MTRSERVDLDAAQRKLVRVQKAAAEVIKIMTAEQALRAQRVVKEAGRRD